MNIKLSFMTLSAVIVLASCGNGDKTTVPSEDKSGQITIPALEPGAHRVVLGLEDDPIIGQYYVGSNQEKLLVLNDQEQRANKVYYSQDKQNWQSLPTSTKSEELKFSNQEKINAQQLSIDHFTGQYAVALDEQQTVKVNIDAAGKISTLSSGCNITGQLLKSSMPNLLQYTATAKNCAGIPESLKGYMLQDDDYAPAIFRMININQQLKDFWGYTE